MMNTIHILVLLFFMMGCAFFKPSPHNHMLPQMRDHSYHLELPELKKRVLDSMEREFSLFDSKTIMIDHGHPSMKMMAESDLVCRNWHYSFHYQDRIYQSKNDALDVLNPGGWKEQVSSMGKEGMIMLEETDDRFVFIQNHLIFTGTRLGPGESSLTIEGIKKMVYHPDSQGSECEPCERWTSDQLKRRDGNGMSVTGFDQCLVDLEKSLAHTQRAYPAELRFLYYLDEQKAKQMETLE